MSDVYTPRLQGAYLTPTVAAEQVSGGFGSTTIMGVEGLFCLLIIQGHLAVTRVPWCRCSRHHIWPATCATRRYTDWAEHPPFDGTGARQTFGKRKQSQQDEVDALRIGI